MTDVIELIRADHRRILRLASVLDSTGRSSGEVGPDTALASVWDWLAGLIEVHTAAEEEICGLTFRRLGLQCGPDHDDIRAALQEAGLRRPGSDDWWQAVSAAILLCTRHFSSEEREILPALREGAALAARRDLACQWRRYVLAWMRDGGRSQQAQRLPTVIAMPGPKDIPAAEVQIGPI